MLLGQIQDHHHQSHSRNEKRLPVSMIDLFDKIHDQRRIRRILKSHIAIENPMLYSEDHTRKHHVDALHIRTIQEYSGAKFQSNFFSQQILGRDYTLELCHIGIAKYVKKEDSFRTVSNKTKSISSLLHTVNCLLTKSTTRITTRSTL